MLLQVVALLITCVITPLNYRLKIEMVNSLTTMVISHYVFVSNEKHCEKLLKNSLLSQQLHLYKRPLYPWLLNGVMEGVLMHGPD